MSVTRSLAIKFVNSLRRLMEYKTNLFFALIIQIVYFSMILTFLLVIYNQVPDIYGWNIYDIIVYALFTDMSSSFVNFWGLWFNYDVIGGSLNSYLTRPINEFVLYIQYNIVDMLFFFMTFCLLIYAFFAFTYNTTILHIVLGILIYIFTLPLFFLPLLTIRSLAFYFGEVSALEGSYNSFVYSFDRIPNIILNKVFFTIFMIITPMGFLHWFVPAAVALNKISIEWGLIFLGLSILLEIFMFFTFRYIYKKGLSKYEGFG